MSQQPQDPAQDPAQDTAEDPAEDRIEARAELLPEEKAAGSDDPRLQAQTILDESAERTEDPERTRHESTQTPDPD